MAYELTIYEGAKRDLEESVRYVSTVLEAPGAARALIDEYEDKLRLIASNPCLFAVDLAVSEAVGQVVRRCPVKRYGVYFVVHEAEQTVYIVAFVHGPRDTPSVIGGHDSW